MLSWDEEVKPTPSTSFTGNASSGRSPQLPPQMPALQPVSSAAPRSMASATAFTTAPATTAGAASAPAPVSIAAASTHRIKAADKRIINGQTDVNQLVPFK